VVVGKLGWARPAGGEEADGSAGHFEGLTLFLYNPQSRQWSLKFFPTAMTQPGQPSVRRIQEWARRILRSGAIQWQSISAELFGRTSRRIRIGFEQAFSDDGGKTWSQNFVAMLTREKQVAPNRSANPPARSAMDGTILTSTSALGKNTHRAPASLNWLTTGSNGRHRFSARYERPRPVGGARVCGPNGHLDLLSLRSTIPEPTGGASLCHQQFGYSGQPRQRSVSSKWARRVYTIGAIQMQSHLGPFHDLEITSDSAPIEQAFSMMEARPGKQTGSTIH